MGFCQATITAVNPPLYSGFQVYLSWTTSSPAGTWFQIYINQALAWWGQTTSARLVLGTIGPVRVDIGTVLAGEEQTSYAGSLASAPARSAELAWLGGTFESPEIAGFQVWQTQDPTLYGYGGFGDGPFGGIALTELLATITAYPSGIITDGFGFGGFGDGGFGQAPGTYTWTSDPLTNGVWWFAVIPYDSAGNLGTPAATSVTIAVPPLEPALFDDETRLALHVQRGHARSDA